MEALAARVILVHRGRIVFDGPTPALAAGGSLEAAFHRLTHDESRSEVPTA